MYEGDEYSGQQYYGDYDNDGVHFQETYPDMPDSVRVFLNKLHDAIKEGNVADIQILYENTFPQLSESHFDKTEWPNVKEVKQVVGLSGQDDKDIFLILYNELYYRHIYAHVQPGPKLDHRIASFYNYCDLFNELIHDFTVPLELPDVWLWELIDEFVYQFQNFQRYVARLTDAENMEPPYPVWHIMSILNVLHSLVEISNIKQQLEVSSAGGDPSTVAGAFGSRALYKMLGYFSLIGLLRVHSLQGDYYLAIKALEPIELHKKSEYSHIPACQISTSYYVGFAYMMMRRYSDAIRTFSSILLYIQRTKQLYSARSYQNDQINKQTDNMYHLLAICLVLHPQYIDESIQQVLRDKNYHDSMVKMQGGDLETFSNFFVLACPKFVSRCLSFDGQSEPCPKDPIEQQLEVFKDEVRQQIQLPIIRSYLKLYKTLPLEKLLLLKCSQKGDDGEDEQADANTLLMNLLCFKHKMKNVVWTKGASGLEGKFQSGSELDFFIDNDMIHIADTRVAHRYGDFFIRKILKFAELNRRLHSINIK